MRTAIAAGWKVGPSWSPGPGAVRPGHLAGAGLDALREEPARRDHPLLGQPNVVVTPHIAWLTPETLERRFLTAVDNASGSAAAGTFFIEFATGPPADEADRSFC